MSSTAAPIVFASLPAGLDAAQAAVAHDQNYGALCPDEPGFGAQSESSSSPKTESAVSSIATVAATELATAAKPPIRRNRLSPMTRPRTRRKR
jgi:hypothetical protein